MYMVYGKNIKTMKRFAPMDMKSNSFQTNKIYASLFNGEDLEALKKEVDFMNKNNPQFKFEIRKQS